MEEWIPRINDSAAHIISVLVPPISGVWATLCVCVNGLTHI